MEALRIDTPTWQPPRYFPGADSGEVHEATKTLRLEEVVLKRTAAPYEPGKRISARVKAKHFRFDSLVVGGIRPPTGSRGLSGLVVGWPLEDGLLDYAGTVEIGFSPGERTLVMTSLERCATGRCPFPVLPCFES